jgi:hypothetical protein
MGTIPECRTGRILQSLKLGHKAIKNILRWEKITKQLRAVGVHATFISLWSYGGSGWHTRKTSAMQQDTRPLTSRLRWDCRKGSMRAFARLCSSEELTSSRLSQSSRLFWVTCWCALIRIRHSLYKFPSKPWAFSPVGQCSVHWWALEKWLYEA